VRFWLSAEGVHKPDGVVIPLMSLSVGSLRSNESLARRESSPPF
jgi:hypothetical protein